MRFHVVSLPHTQTTDAYSACAFTMKVINFCRMMKDRGHTVFLYAGEENEAPCDELITCISETERAEHVGDKHYIFSSFDYSLPVWQKFNANAARNIAQRAEPTDIVCAIGGLAHKQVADALPNMITVEFGVGYGGTFSKFRVWESYAWMHTCYGAASAGNPNAADGQWFDAVIPGYADPARFPYRERKDDYLFFIGRLTARKGYQIAIDVARDLGRKIIVAGQMDHGCPPPADCEYVGVVGPEERGKLMAGAAACFAPTIYIEPFGNVVVEAQMCGTPVITTDWGAFTENVIDGVTGFRCRTFGEFRRATERAGTLDPATIRRHAVANYSLEVVGEKYERYFERLSHLFADGWYEGRTC